MIKLYGNASPNVLKISIALNELDLPYDWEHVDIWSGQQFSPPIKALNPLCKVPILVEKTYGGGTHSDDGETVLFESGAILLYLAEKEPGILVPETNEERLEVLKWLFVQCANIGPMFGQLTHFASYAGSTEGYALRRYQGQVRRLYDVLEERLSQFPFLAGHHYSLADIATYPWIRLHEAQVEELGPAVSRWFAQVSSRPAVSKAVQRHIEVIRPADIAMRQASQTADLNVLFPGRT